MVAPLTWDVVYHMIKEHWMAKNPSTPSIFEPACETHNWMLRDNAPNDSSIYDSFHIVACDLYPERKSTCHEWFQVDLNQPFEDWGFRRKQFDYTVAVEAIEHLENIYNFMRGLVYYTKKEIIISTPDITAPASLENVLFGDGYFSWYHWNSFDQHGHINIAYKVFVERYMKDILSARLIEKTWNQPLEDHHYKNPNETALSHTVANKTFTRRQRYPGTYSHECVIWRFGCPK